MLSDLPAVWPPTGGDSLVADRPVGQGDFGLHLTTFGRGLDADFLNKPRLHILLLCLGTVTNDLRALLSGLDWGWFQKIFAHKTAADTVLSDHDPIGPAHLADHLDILTSPQAVHHNIVGSGATANIGSGAGAIVFANDIQRRDLAYAILQDRNLDVFACILGFRNRGLSRDLGI